ncbi:hypothetical protein TrRE_jg13283, partial [Triparma retinervis]
MNRTEISCTMPESPPSTPVAEKKEPAKKAPTNMRATTPGKRDPTSARVIEGLKLLYHEKLHPIEAKYAFGSFHYQPISDAEIEAKPQVLLVGQYSTGKTTFISHLLKEPYPNAHI